MNKVAGEVGKNKFELLGVRLMVYQLSLFETWKTKSQNVEWANEANKWTTKVLKYFYFVIDSSRSQDDIQYFYVSSSPLIA